jgi:hypothetical protein
MMATDAAACYGRIITYLLNVCVCRHGLPKNACVAKGMTVFEMLRKVRTAYGESDAFYTSVGDDFMHGEFQGKTSSPPSWAIYTISMIRALGKFNPGVNIKCVEGIHTIHRLADMFVDDNDMWTESSDNSSLNEKTNPMNDFRRAAQAWERIVFASGGLLALHKCYWWMVGWKWLDGMPKLLDKSELDVSLALENGNDTAKRTIQNMGPNNDNVGLGFCMAPSGTHKPEIDFRKKQSDSLTSRLGTSHLNPCEAWVLYSSVYIPKVYFPCKISSFSENEWAYVTC